MLRAVVVLAQGAKQRGAFFQSQGLRASGGLHSRLRQRRAQLGFRISGFEIVPQSLALLAKRKLEKIDEAIFRASGVKAKLVLPRRNGETQHGGMYFRRR